ncbi:MAG: hypothetical protein HQL09_05390 [Nitrospirae bacterium]|nr:hypothetical protein [Nitrospirota bacterium]
MSRSVLLIFVSAVFLFGCATTRSILYDKSERLPKPAAYEVEIFSSAGLQRPYRIIGVAIAATGPFHHFQDAIAHLQAEAGRMGGDALIDPVQGLPKGAAMPEGGWFIFGDKGEIWSAKVIVWE